MSLDFPASPFPGQTLTSEGRTFIWSGSVWLMQAEDIPWATLEQALAGVSTDTIMAPDTMKALIQASEPPPPSYGPLTCRAWGLINSQTGAIVAHRNIAAAVVGPEGQMAVTFQTPLPNASYLIHASNRFNDTTGFTVGYRVSVEPTVNGFSLTSGNTGGSGVVGVARWGATQQVAVFL